MSWELSGGKTELLTLEASYSAVPWPSSGPQDRATGPLPPQAAACWEPQQTSRGWPPDRAPRTLQELTSTHEPHLSHLSSPASTKGNVPKLQRSFSRKDKIQWLNRTATSILWSDHQTLFHTAHKFCEGPKLATAYTRSHFSSMFFAGLNQSQTITRTCGKQYFVKIHFTEDLRFHKRTRTKNGNKKGMSIIVPFHKSQEPFTLQSMNQEFPT